MDKFDEKPYLADRPRPIPPRLNKPYIVFVAAAGTAALTFIGWMVTSQVYKEWSHGLPISGGWNWPIVIGVDLACLFVALALYWEIYADSRTTIDAIGVGRPSLRGQRHIAWSDVTSIKVFGGVGFHVYAGTQKIVVSPYAYREPQRVIEALRHHALSASHVKR